MNRTKRTTSKGPSPPRKRSRAPASRELPREDSFPIVGIGASAGGLEAFKELLTALPEKGGMAYVLIPHLDPSHQSVLKEILSRFTKIPITEVRDGMQAERDRIFVIPPNMTMGITGGKFILVERNSTQTPHLPIDHFLQSLANDQGERAIGIVLSGTASDGTQGCIAIKVAGGITFAQDQKSAKYFDMPENAIRGGSIDFVLPPREIARELTRIRRTALSPHLPPESLDREVAGDPSELDALFALLQKATDVDFRHYKQSTLQRRIKRRMDLHQLSKLKDYLRYVDSHPTELDDLFSDLLIHVTEFFRDKGSFEVLQRKILPNLFRGRKPEEGPLRVWVPGCSTGQEVYSLAMIFLEFLWAHDRGARFP